MQSETELKTVVIFSYVRPKDCCLHSVPRGDPYNGLYGGGGGGGTPRKAGYHFPAQAQKKRVEILLVEVYEGEGKSFLLSGKKARKVLQIHFMALKKSKKRSGFVIYSYFFSDRAY